MRKNLLIALCLCPFDKELGFKLLRLWADLEDSFNPVIEVAICLRFDMSETDDIDKEAIEYASKKFKIHIKRIKDREGTGWPNGCNALETGAYMWFVEKTRSDKKVFNFDYLFIVEADTIPLRKGWANEIRDEAYNNNAKVLGAYFMQEDGYQHINGNMVIHKEAHNEIPGIFLIPSGVGWDVYVGGSTTAIGTPSKLIWQDYHLGTPRNPWRGADDLFEEKSFKTKSNPLFNVVLKPAMLHGIKTTQGINAVRERVLGEKIAVEIA